MNNLIVFRDSLRCVHRFLYYVFLLSYQLPVVLAKKGRETRKKKTEKRESLLGNVYICCLFTCSCLFCRSFFCYSSVSTHHRLRPWGPPLNQIKKHKNRPTVAES